MFIVKTLLIVLLSLVWARAALAHGISDTDRQDIIDGGYLKYIELGADHMLTGYDHLLFLLGVVFFLIKFRDVAKFITALTIGHSITLIFATYLEIAANYYLFDAVIALTVVYKGFDSLSGVLYYDFHGEAHDARPDEFTSFETTTSDKSASSLKAPFTGRVGSRTFAEVRAGS